MKMSKNLLNVAIVSTLVASAGCVSRDVYRPDGEVISGRPGETTAYELDAALEHTDEIDRLLSYLVERLSFAEGLYDGIIDKGGSLLVGQQGPEVL